MKGRDSERDFSIRVGARIESLRHERGLSLRELAQMAECSAGHLSLMESGISAINVITLQKIARALRVKPYDLLNHTPDDGDIGYVVEMMRKDTGVGIVVRQLVS